MVLLAVHKNNFWTSITIMGPVYFIVDGKMWRESIDVYAFFGESIKNEHLISSVENYVFQHLVEMLNY